MPTMRRVVFGNAQNQRFMSDDAIRNATSATLVWGADPDSGFHFITQQKCKNELKRRRNAR